MKSLRMLIPVMATAFTACAQDPTPAAGIEVTKTNGGLTLTVATPERVAGSYVDHKGVLVKFDSARVGDALYLDVVGADGLHLIQIQTLEDAYVFSYMGGRLKMHASKAFVAEARAQPEATATDGFEWQGDRNVLDEMLQRPEMAALPFLSRALGERGFTGATFPSSLALHKIARQSAEGLGIEVPQLEIPASGVGYCQDLRSDPNRNGCYGMCGRGCGCWSWVCGNCCYHGGCAKHDSWCRNGQWYYCYNITAVIALFGC